VNYKMDQPLAPHLLKHDWILPHSSIYTIIGKAKSGKSVLINSLFSTKGDKKIFRKVFNKVFYFCPPSSFHKD
jgi:hypothetical protein